MNLRIFPAALATFASLMFGCGRGEGSEPAAKETPTEDTLQRIGKTFLSDCKVLYSRARQMDSVLLQETTVNESNAKKAIAAFTDFAFYCQSDTMSPVYLIKTAQVARAINSIPQAKTALDRCVETYLNSPHRAAALFLLAQLYDEPGYLNNEQEAKRLYSQIIEEYPKSDWALSAKGALVFIGKTDQEIMEAFEKKNKTKK